MQKFDVSTICNALVDILVQISDDEFKALGIEKGVMHLTTTERQKEILETFRDHTQTVELGGSSLNAIRTLRHLGATTTFAGAVGKDKLSQKITSRMSELGISNNLKEVEEQTGTCVVLITPEGERTMNTHLGASRLVDSSLVDTNQIGNSQIFHFCGYQWDTEGQIDAIEKAIEVAKDHGTLVSFDVADPFVVERNRDKFCQLIAEKADIVFANKDEAKLLYQSTPENAAQEIANQGKTAVIKLGADGALIQRGDKKFPIAPIPTQVVDTTGAGDMFAAGFLFGVVKGLPLDQCGNIAATVASDVISRVGASVSPHTLQSIKADIAQ